MPASSVVALSGGEEIEGFRVAYVPGHASHHVAYLHQATGDAYVGDVAGVRIPPRQFTSAPTPPPDIDVEAWERSLETVAEWLPQRLCLTHFGRVDDVDRAARAPAPGAPRQRGARPPGRSRAVSGRDGGGDRRRRRRRGGRAAAPGGSCGAALAGARALLEKRAHSQPETLGYPARTSHGPSPAHKIGCRVARGGPRTRPWRRRRARRGDRLHEQLLAQVRGQGAPARRAASTAASAGGRRRRACGCEVKKGPGACGYRPPVEGDSDGPDHDFQAKGKLLRATPKGLRGSAYLAIAVRSGKSSRYELRIFPKKHKFELRRAPSGGGGGFPETGQSRAIKGVDKPNVLRLKAAGNKVTARVNCTKVAKVTDSNAGQVGGRKLEVGVGSKRSTNKQVVGHLRQPQAAGPEPVARHLTARCWHGTETLERPRTGGPGSGLGGNWLVIVLNDDHNTFDHVAKTLARVIPGVDGRRGLPVRRPDPPQRPGDRLDGAEGAGRALLGAAPGRGADHGPPGAALTSVTPRGRRLRGRPLVWEISRDELPFPRASSKGGRFGSLQRPCCPRAAAAREGRRQFGRRAERTPRVRL